MTGYENIFESLRVENHLTIKDLASKLQIDRNKISRIESGQIPDGEALKAYSKYFNKSTDHLLGLSKAETVDENIKMICKSTGLSEYTVNRLIEDNKSENEQARHYYAPVINDLIEFDGLHFIDSIFTYLYPFFHFDDKNIEKTMIMKADATEPLQMIDGNIGQIIHRDKSGVEIPMLPNNIYTTARENIIGILEDIRIRIRAKRGDTMHFEYGNKKKKK